MTQAAPARTKIPTKSPQPAPGRAARPAGRAKHAAGAARSQVLASGNGRAATRGGGEVIELECGITVYPARSEGGRWRAVWHEDGERQQCEAATEEKLAAKLEKVRDAAGSRRAEHEEAGRRTSSRTTWTPTASPSASRWSRKHAHTQRRLCERFAAPVIAAVTCQDIKTGHMQKIVNAAPTAGEGDRVRRMISALVTAGIDAGYLVNSRLAKVHWQAGDRPLPAPAVSVAGESAQWVDPAEIPSDDDIARLGQALAAGRARGPRRADGQHRRLQRPALGRADRPHHPAGRPGRPRHHRRPQGRRGRRAPVRRGAEEPQAPQDDLPAPHARRATRSPSGSPPGSRQARAEQEAGTNPLGLIFPSPKGKHWRSSNFSRNVLKRAYLAAGWRDADGNGAWTWHSLRHVFCTTALFTWKLDATDVSRMAGHANYRITLDMYVGTTAGVLDRARTATE